MVQRQFELDPRVDDAIRKAAEYARYLGSGIVDTEHLVLGFLCAGRDIFRHAPNTTIRAAILDRVQRSGAIEPCQELPFAAGAVRALRLPVAGDREAAAIKLQPEHVLIAILNETGSLAADVLNSFGITSRDDMVFESGP